MIRATNTKTSTTTMTMIKILKALVVIDLGIILCCLLQGQMIWLLNTQVGFITSSLVIFGSFLGYRRMVQRRVEAGDVPYERDVIDRIEDPYELDEEIEEAQEQDFKEVVKEQKRKQKENKRSMMQVMKDSKGAMSLYRVISYLLLFVGFVALNNNGLFHTQSYLFAVILAPIVIILLAYRYND